MMSATFGYGVANADEHRVSVQTADTEVFGKLVQTKREAVAQFSGIRYAFAERWQPPQREPLDKPIDALYWPPICPQLNGNTRWYERVADAFDHSASVVPTRPNIDEDCLFLNIWTPSATLAKGAAPLPVMVWIHGGSNKNGYSYEPNYLGHELASRGVVVVSIQYRLGILGFLAHPDFPVPGSGNFGLLDQITALEWIAKHIESFGGDPGNVTLFGESAGAADIGYLLMLPKANGLFHRAISQSGGWHTQRETTLSEAAERGLALSRGLSEASPYNSANGARQAANGTRRLRKLSALSLVRIAASEFPTHYWDPVIDRITLPDAAPALLATGGIQPLPLLIGFNRDEALMYQPNRVSEADWQQVLADNQLIADRSDPVFKASVLAMPLRQRLNLVSTALNYACPSQTHADVNARAGANTFFYEFSQTRSGTHGLGAYHGAEIPYVFDTHDPWLPTTAGDRELTELMMRYWVNFARTGNPNESTFSPGTQSLPKWPKYDASAPVAMQLAATPTARPMAELTDDLCKLLGSGNR